MAMHKPSKLSTDRAVVRKGATGAIAPVDFGRDAQIAPFNQDLITILAPVD